ncbi:MAG: phosphoadenylyl-sulfate reductase [Arcobacteraceae bacterium]
MNTTIDELNKKFQNSNPQEILEYFITTYKDTAALSSSLGAEDQVLTDMIFTIDTKANIFTLDTGRLHPETYNVMDETNLKYTVKLNVFFPKNEDIETLYNTQGINGHFESIDNRKNCCGIRKMEPLKRALKPLKVWITGLRAAQSVTRTDMPIVEFDEHFDVIKVNPLINWSEEDVWEYIKANNVPYNKLHDQGYPSIGCAPCTRPVKAGDDIRSGRWWWENPEHKECGLHAK